MTYERDCFISDPMITEYTAKDAPAVVTLNVNSNNSRYQGNRKYTNIKNNDTVEAGNET